MRQIGAQEISSRSMRKRLLVYSLLLGALVFSGCTRQAPGTGVSQLPVDETSTSLPEPDGDDLVWQISFIYEQPLTYLREARHTFVTGADFTAEMTFSAAVDPRAFEVALRRGVQPTGGDPVLTWESEQAVLLDVRGCNGRARIDLTPLARRSGLKRAAPLVIYCGPKHDVLEWRADRGTEIVGSVPDNFAPSTAHSEDLAVFYHRMRPADGGTDVGVWLADFSARTLKPLAVHYHGAALETAFMDRSSLVVTTGGDGLQIFGSSGVRVRQFDPDDLGLIVGMEVDDKRGRIALFEAEMDDSGRTGDTRLRVVDRGFVDTSRVAGAGKLSRLSGRWRTVDAAWLDPDTIAFIHWDNRFYGVVAIANVSNRTVAKTSVVADQLAGVLSDGRFVVRRQAGGRAGCWRAENSEGRNTTPLCERLPGPVHADVSPDGNLVALKLPDTREVVVWNRLSSDRRRIGIGDVAGWTPDGSLRWISQRHMPSEEEELDEDDR